MRLLNAVLLASTLYAQVPTVACDWTAGDVDAENSSRFGRPTRLDLTNPKDQSATIRMVGGESEGLLIPVHAEPGKKISFMCKSCEGADIAATVAVVGTVRLANGDSVPDPIIPVSYTQTYSTKEGEPLLLYLKVSAPPDNAAASRRITLEAVEAGKKNGSKFTLQIEKLPFSLAKQNDLIVQASIWGGGNAIEKMNETGAKNMLRLLSRYGVNGFAGGGLGLGQESYRRLVTYALDELGYKIVRLSPDKMYSARKPMSGLFDRGLDEEAFTKELQSHYSQFDDLLANERWAGKLSTKLWDEPRPKDYADVVKSYSALRKAYPALLRELSEQPGEALSGAADIWVVYTKFLREQDVIEQHKQGKKMWLYANDLHGIDQPLGSMRNIGWLLWYYNLDGYHFWAINWWRKDPWSTASTREVDFLKRGTLLYPDQSQNNDAVVSLRLEYFREGIEDFQLLRQIAAIQSRKGQAGIRAQRLLSSIRAEIIRTGEVKTSLNPNHFRDEMLDIILAAHSP